MKKLLYIHDKENWAIHNVGKLWLDDLKDCICVDFMRKPNKNILNNYDYVWFGFHTLWLSYKDFDKSKSIVSIHDPCELSGVEKSLLENIKVITASKQMSNYLLQKNVMINAIIPTTGFLNYQDENKIKDTTKIKLLTIGSDKGRKNIKSVYNLFDKCNKELGIESYAKIGIDKFLTIEEYSKLFDDYNVYICLSRQEGGPLPAMEAMQRGCVVLSTEVGQMPELINGNGFILKENDFFEKIKWIQKNMEWVNNARKESLKIIKKYRDPANIKKIVKNFLENEDII